MRSGIVRIALLLAAVGLVASLGLAVFAADDPTVKLELKDVDARSAIEALFKGTGKNVAIDPDVSGITVASISFNDVPFDQALKNLVKSAGLVYRLDDGIYHISKKPEVAAGVPTATTTPDLAVVDTTTAEETTIEKVPLSNTGASEILNMMSGNGGSGSQSNWGGGSSGFGNMGSFGGGSNFGGGGSNFGGGSFGGSSNFGGGGSNFGSSRSYGGGNSSYGRSSSYGGNRGW